MGNLYQNYKNYVHAAIAMLLCLLIGYGGGRYAQPAKVITKTETVEKEKIVTNDNVVTVVKEIDRPDGTKEKTTETVDKSTITNDTDTTTKTTKDVERKTLDWKVGALAKPDFSDHLKPTYGIQIERRVIGSIYVGGAMTTNREFFASVGILF